MERTVRRPKPVKARARELERCFFAAGEPHGRSEERRSSVIILSHRNLESVSFDTQKNRCQFEADFMTAILTPYIPQTKFNTGLSSRTMGLSSTGISNSAFPLRSFVWKAWRGHELWWASRSHNHDSSHSNFNDAWCSPPAPGPESTQFSLSLSARRT